MSNQTDKISDCIEYLNLAPKEQIEKALQNNAFFAGKITKPIKDKENEDREYQKRVIKRIGVNQSTAFESGPGSGKTRIAAAASLNFLNKTKTPGKSGVMFICTSEHLLGGIRDRYAEYFHSNDGIYTLPRKPNSINPLNDVFFFSPRKIYDLSNNNQVVPSNGSSEFEQICDRCGMLVVDESHHFPSDSGSELKLFGQIHSLWEKFSSEGKKVVSMTATHGRMDGKTVLGISRKDLDEIITIKNVIDAGHTPSIFGAQITMNIKVNGEWCGDVCSLSFASPAEEDKYLNAVVDVMACTYNQRPKSFCAFVSRRSRARKISKKFNKLTGLNIGIIVAETPISKRNQIMADISSGKRVGYITCSAGSESLDIPCLEVVHLVRRTNSINLLVQSVGRVLRKYPNKDSVLIIDYALLKSNIARSCVGIMDFAEHSGDDAESIPNGGMVVGHDSDRRRTKNIEFCGCTIGAANEWIRQDQRQQREKTIEELLRTGKPQPHRHSLNKIHGFTEKQLYGTLYSNPVFLKFIKKLARELGVFGKTWFKESRMKQQKQQVVEELLRSGKPQPRSNSLNKINGFTEKQLHITLFSGNPVFRESMKKLARELGMFDMWFKKSHIAKQQKQQVVEELLRSGKPQPRSNSLNKINGFTEKRLYAVLVANPVFRESMKKLARELGVFGKTWFKNLAAEQKQQVVEELLRSRKPRLCSASLNKIGGFTEKQLYVVLYDNPVFCESMKKLARELGMFDMWFKNINVERKREQQQKQQVVEELLRSGKPKPHYVSSNKIHGFTERQLYITLHNDSVFLKSVKKLAKGLGLYDMWFKESRMKQQKKQIVEELLRSGKPKPKWDSLNKIDGFTEKQLCALLCDDRAFRKSMKKLDKELGTGWWKHA